MTNLCRSDNLTNSRDADDDLCTVRNAFRWKRMRTAIKENICLSFIFLVVMLIFLSGFIFFAYAYFESRRTSSKLEIVTTTTTTSITETKLRIKSTETSMVPPQTSTTPAPTPTTPAPVANKTSERLCSSSHCIRAASYLIESMDFEADPCEDFNQFTCGNWHNYHIRSELNSRRGWHSIVIERVNHAIEVFLESKPKPKESKVINQSRIMYKSCKSYRDQFQTKKLRIKKIISVLCFPFIYGETTCEFDWTATFGILNETLSKEDISHSIGMIANGQYVMDKLENYFKFLNHYRKKATNELIADNIKQASHILTNIPGKDIESKFRMNKIPAKPLESIFFWIIIDTFIGSMHFVGEFDYDKSNYCARLVNEKMGIFLGDTIAIPNFLNTTKPKLLNTFEDIRSTFNGLVNNSDWMDQVTKRAVIEKSNAMKVNVGFAEFLLNKTKVDAYLKDLNLMEDSLADNLETMNKIQEKLHTMLEWDVLDRSPTNINAYYYVRKNTLLITMGYLQFPFYGLGIEALNYGFGITSLGHEFSHGFDNYGRRFDKYGRKIDRWTRKTKIEYENRTNCLIDQYNNFNLSEIDPTVNGTADGYKTLGENIADNVGLLLAYKAYKMFIAKHGEEEILPALQQFTPDQLFFIGFGNKRCESMSAKTLANWSDGHSLGKFRVNAPVSNMKEFREAFKCNANAKMVSKNPCRIW